MTGHTPTPWSVQNAGDIWQGEKESPVIPLFKVANQDRSWGREYPHEERAANAALIVRAVNRDHAFDEVVKALIAAEKAIDNCLNCRNHLGFDALRTVRAALAKAGSES